MKRWMNSERQLIAIILHGANMNDIKFGVLPNNEIESKEFAYNGRRFADGDMNFKLILENGNIVISVESPDKMQMFDLLMINKDGITVYGSKECNEDIIGIKEVYDEKLGLYVNPVNFVE